MMGKPGKELKIQLRPFVEIFHIILRIPCDWSREITLKIHCYLRKYLYKNYFEFVYVFVVGLKNDFTLLYYFAFNLNAKINKKKEIAK